MALNRKSLFAPGKNPNSIKNLSKPRPISFPSKVARQINWEVLCVKGFQASVGKSVYWAMIDPNWHSLTLARRDAIIATRKELEKVMKALDAYEASLRAVKDTPLRTPEALALARRERRMRRNGLLP